MGGVADTEGDLAASTRPENFIFPDLSGAEQSSGKLKGENGAVLVWDSAQKFQQIGNTCLTVSLQ
jgi:hypothetical protein